MAKHIKIPKGTKFGRWTVLEYDENSPYRKPKYICQCNCSAKSIKSVYAKHLKRGSSLSCGCLCRERISSSNKKYNKYDLSGEYGVCYSSNTNEPILFDIEDYELIKDFCWYISYTAKGKYKKVTSSDCNKKSVRMCNIILNNKYIDHINKNTLDNRKTNLRKVTHQQNMFNCSTRKNSKSGVPGVRYSKASWKVSITYNKFVFLLGAYPNLESAIRARLQAEFILFKEYSPNSHLFDKYKVNNTTMSGLSLYDVSNNINKLKHKSLLESYRA